MASLLGAYDTNKDCMRWAKIFKSQILKKYSDVLEGALSINLRGVFRGSVFGGTRDCFCGLYSAKQAIVFPDYTRQNKQSSSRIILAEGAAIICVEVYTAQQAIVIPPAMATDLYIPPLKKNFTETGAEAQYFTPSTFHHVLFRSPQKFFSI